MGKVTVIGSFTCHAGKAEEAEKVLAEMVEAARDEPGVEVYSYHRGDDDKFWFFALMSDEDAMASHGQSEAMKTAMSSFMSLVPEPPEMNTVKPVAAIGLDL